MADFDKAEKLEAAGGIDFDYRARERKLALGVIQMFTNDKSIIKAILKKVVPQGKGMDEQDYIDLVAKECMLATDDEDVTSTSSGYTFPLCDSV